MSDGSQPERGLLDTSVVVDLHSFDPADLPIRGDISAVTLAELSVGPIYAPTAHARSKRQSLLDHARTAFHVLSFDGATAHAYVTLSEATFTRGGGKPRGSKAMDLLIAATALAHDLPLYTRDAGDFSALADVVDVRCV